MAHIWKSMELIAFGALSVWGSYRALEWLHEPPVRTQPVVWERL